MISTPNRNSRIAHCSFAAPPPPPEKGGGGGAEPDGSDDGDTSTIESAESNYTNLIYPAFVRTVAAKR